MMANSAAAAIRTLSSGTTRVTASPNRTAGTFAAIMPRVVPMVTNSMLWNRPAVRCVVVTQGPARQNAQSARVSGRMGSAGMLSLQ